MAWFRAHPTVEMVSRDRSAEYARAIRQGAPHAIQVADRFHLMQNLREAVQELLGQYWKELRERPKPSEDVRAEAVAPREVDEWRPHPHPRRETIRVARQAERAERYEQVVALQAQGLSTQAIADRLQYSERSIRRWLAQGTLTYTRRRRKKRSHFDASAPYVLKRWSQGCRNGQLMRDFRSSLLEISKESSGKHLITQVKRDFGKSLLTAKLWREITAQGYHDSPRMLSQYLRALRNESLPVLAEESSSLLDTLTFHRAIWFFLRDPADLDPTAQEQLAALQQVSPQAAQAYRLVQAFAQMVRHRTGETQLVPWLDDVAQSQFPAFAQFADGLKADQEAVVAGLTLPWSQGQVNRLKVIKRSMYGRAKFDLLRPRVLRLA